MIKKDTQYFKEKLEKEKKILEDELGTVGQKRDGKDPAWEATSGTMEVDTADENEVADKLEELEENELILGQLEKQLNEVKAALERIENDTFGICEISGGPIENDRLEANPSARTCVKHMNQH
ncbi:MAG: TraR/DksA C4-type zinc finger protein [bacterium]|nr:TraR/DksA C4-type zinc finger protein [bacterium]